MVQGHTVGVVLVFPDTHCLIPHSCAEIAVVGLGELMDIGAVAVDNLKASLCLAASVALGSKGAP